MLSRAATSGGSPRPPKHHLPSSRHRRGQPGPPGGPDGPLQRVWVRGGAHAWHLGSQPLCNATLGVLAATRCRGRPHGSKESILEACITCEHGRSAARVSRRPSACAPAPNPVPNSPSHTFPCVSPSPPRLPLHLPPPAHPPSSIPIPFLVPNPGNSRLTGIPLEAASLWHQSIEEKKGRITFIAHFAFRMRGSAGCTTWRTRGEGGRGFSIQGLARKRNRSKKKRKKYYPGVKQQT